MKKGFTYFQRIQSLRRGSALLDGFGFQWDRSSVFSLFFCPKQNLIEVPFHIKPRRYLGG